MRKTTTLGATVKDGASSTSNEIMMPDGSGTTPSSFVVLPPQRNNESTFIRTVDGTPVQGEDRHKNLQQGGGASPFPRPRGRADDKNNREDLPVPGTIFSPGGLLAKREIEDARRAREAARQLQAAALLQPAATTTPDRVVGLDVALRRKNNVATTRTTTDEQQPRRGPSALTTEQREPAGKSRGAGGLTLTKGQDEVGKVDEEVIPASRTGSRDDLFWSEAGGDEVERAELLNDYGAAAAYQAPARAEDVSVVDDSVEVMMMPKTLSELTATSDSDRDLPDEGSRGRTPRTSSKDPKPSAAGAQEDGGSSPSITTYEDVDILSEKEFHRTPHEDQGKRNSIAAAGDGDPPSSSWTFNIQAAAAEGPPADKLSRKITDTNYIKRNTNKDMLKKISAIHDPAASEVDLDDQDKEQRPGGAGAGLFAVATRTSTSATTAASAKKKLPEQQDEVQQELRGHQDVEEHHVVDKHDDDYGHRHDHEHLHHYPPKHDFVIFGADTVIGKLVIRYMARRQAVSGTWSNRFVFAIHSFVSTKEELKAWLALNIPDEKIRSKIGVYSGRTTTTSSGAGEDRNSSSQKNPRPRHDTTGDLQDVAAGGLHITRDAAGGGARPPRPAPAQEGVVIPATTSTGKNPSASVENTRNDKETSTPAPVLPAQGSSAVREHLLQEVPAVVGEHHDEHRVVPEQDRGLLHHEHYHQHHHHDNINYPTTEGEVEKTKEVKHLIQTSSVCISCESIYARLDNEEHSRMIVKYCSKFGKDYADCSNEPDFMRACIAHYHLAASESKARILLSAGSSFLPWDLTLVALQKEIRRDYPFGREEAELRTLRTYSEGLDEIPRSVFEPMQYHILQKPKELAKIRKEKLEKEKELLKIKQQEIKAALLRDEQAQAQHLLAAHEDHAANIRNSKTKSAALVVPPRLSGGGEHHQNEAVSKSFSANGPRGAASPGAAQLHDSRHNSKLEVESGQRQVGAQVEDVDEDLDRLTQQTRGQASQLPAVVHQQATRPHQDESGRATGSPGGNYIFTTNKKANKSLNGPTTLLGIKPLDVEDKTKLDWLYYVDPFSTNPVMAAKMFTDMAAFETSTQQLHGGPKKLKTDPRFQLEKVDTPFRFLSSKKQKQFFRTVPAFHDHRETIDEQDVDDTNAHLSQRDVCDYILSPVTTCGILRTNALLQISTKLTFTDSFLIPDRDRGFFRNLFCRGGGVVGCFTLFGSCGKCNRGLYAPRIHREGRRQLLENEVKSIFHHDRLARVQEDEQGDFAADRGGVDDYTRSNRDGNKEAALMPPPESDQTENPAATADELPPQEVQLPKAAVDLSGPREAVLTGSYETRKHSCITLYAIAEVEVSTQFQAKRNIENNAGGPHQHPHQHHGVHALHQQHKIGAAAAGAAATHQQLLQHHQHQQQHDLQHRNSAAEHAAADGSSSLGSRQGGVGGFPASTTPGSSAFPGGDGNTIFGTAGGGGTIGNSNYYNTAFPFSFSPPPPPGLTTTSIHPQSKLLQRLGSFQPPQFGLQQQHGGPAVGPPQHHHIIQPEGESSVETHPLQGGGSFSLAAGGVDELEEKDAYRSLRAGGLFADGAAANKFAFDASSGNEETSAAETDLASIKLAKLAKWSPSMLESRTVKYRSELKFFQTDSVKMEYNESAKMLCETAILLLETRKRGAVDVAHTSAAGASGQHHHYQIHGGHQVHGHHHHHYDANEHNSHGTAAHHHYPLHHHHLHARSYSGGVGTAGYFLGLPLLERLTGTGNCSGNEVNVSFKIESFSKDGTEVRSVVSDPSTGHGFRRTALLANKAHLFFNNKAAPGSNLRMKHQLGAAKHLHAGAAEGEQEVDSDFLESTAGEDEESDHVAETAEDDKAFPRTRSASRSGKTARDDLHELERPRVDHGVVSSSSPLEVVATGAGVRYYQTATTSRPAKKPRPEGSTSAGVKTLSGVLTGRRSSATATRSKIVSNHNEYNYTSSSSTEQDGTTADLSSTSDEAEERELHYVEQKGNQTAGVDPLDGYEIQRTTLLQNGAMNQDQDELYPQNKKSFMNYYAAEVEDEDDDLLVSPSENEDFIA
ncbi:unnamed protein product [Amoebophrya sp. A120]|nr:unnamed protein product [Amoebophrya sp. A120]|eukprot:GSA120T00019165001.1